jgi:flagellar hook-associated protein 3 FlgL
MAFRVGDNARFNSLQLQIQQSQSRLAEFQIQASTGRAGQNYADIAPRAREALSFENSYIRVKRYQDNIKSANIRIDQFEASINKIQESAETYRTLLVNALNSNNADTIAMAPQARALLDNVAAELNRQIDGKYLFAGSATNTRPVDTTRWGGTLAMPTNLNAPAAYTVPALPGTPAGFPVTIAANASAEYFGYYMANTTLSTIRADDNMNVTYGNTAADPVYAQLIYAMRLGGTIDAAPAAEQRDRLQGALTMMNQLIGNLADLRATVGSQGKLLDDTNKNHINLLSRFEDTVNEIQGADIPLTMTKLSAEQTQLEASYMTITRLNQVSLVKFLR